MFRVDRMDRESFSPLLFREHYKMDYRLSKAPVRLELARLKQEPSYETNY